LPLTDIVTESDCAVEMLAEAGVTVTAGVVLEGGGVVLPPPPPPQPAIHRLPAIPSQNAACRAKLLMRALSLPAPFVSGRSGRWTHDTTVPVRNRCRNQFSCGSHRITASHGIEIIFSLAGAHTERGEQTRWRPAPRAQEMQEFTGVYAFIQRCYAPAALARMD
jgi:hypothetical protein